jgi:hypothetical protein
MFPCSRLQSGFAVAVSLSLYFSATCASALQYQRVPLDPPLIGVAATGPIVPGDFDRLDAFIRTLPQTDHILGFFIDSPGGNILEAEKIALLINKTAATVTIPSDSQCASACFLLFAAAAHRFMGPNALIGVHSASENGEENLFSMGFTTAFARDAAGYGVPDAIIGKLVSTEPGRMTWLTPSDLKPMDVAILTASLPQGPPLPIPPQTQSSPQAPLVSRPHEMLVFVMPVEKAPGDGDETLALALKKRLSASGIKLTNEPSGAYIVRGTVDLRASGSWHQSITVEWRVFNPSGKKLGSVAQRNTIPNGSLDGPWGAVAYAAAGAAVHGVIQLLARDRNPQSVQYSR